MTSDDQRRRARGSRRLVILAIIALMVLAPSIRADDHQMPICTDGEFRAYFNLIAEYQTEFDGAIANANELRRVSLAQIEYRENNLSPQPTCADAIAIQGLLIQLGGDSLADAALELADLPASDNPYRRRLPSDQERIESLVSAMLGLDRGDARPPERRSLPSCAPADLSSLDDAADSFLAAYEISSDETSPAEALSALDRLLLWREENLAGLPECAESVALLDALNRTATDAAAYEAFNYAGVSMARNPFSPLASAGLATVMDWRESRQLDPRAQAASEAQSELPRCSREQLSLIKDKALSAYGELMERAKAAGGIVDLLEFANEEIAFRQSRLAQLPTCAEALAARWWIAQALADVIPRFALDQGGAPAQRLQAIISASQASATAAMAALERAFNDDAPRPPAPGIDSAPACSEGDQLYLFTYLVPKFWRFTDSALKVSRPEDALDLIQRSYTFRQLLWDYLPRCQEALELGLMMRTIAANSASQLALELAGAPVLRIPHLRLVSHDIDLFFERISGYYSTCGNVNGGATTYFVVADNIANIRSCESTACHIVTTVVRGQRLTVVDDMSSWYKIVLPSCETAYIAGFLASRTPPPR